MVAVKEIVESQSLTQRDNPTTLLVAFYERPAYRSQSLTQRDNPTTVRGRTGKGVTGTQVAIPHSEG